MGQTGGDWRATHRVTVERELAMAGPTLMGTFIQLLYPPCHLGP